MLNIYAIYDTLYVIEKTKSQCSGLSLNELNFLSYFACLLSLYQGHPVSEWGYSFLRNNQGAPISAELLESCQMLVQQVELQKQDMIYTITERGTQRMSFFTELSELKSRNPYLDAACNCLLIDSIVSILSIISKDALITESMVHELKCLNSGDNSALSILHEQFDLIKRAIGDHRNLFIPATSWLLYLRQKNVAQ